MADGEGALLPGRDEPVFPLTDRNAPVIDRLRNGTGSFAEDLGENVGKAALADGVEAGKMADDFRAALAAELGVNEMLIQDEVVELVEALYSLDEEDLVKIEGLDEDDEEEDSEDTDSESSLDLSDEE